MKPLVRFSALAFALGALGSCGMAADYNCFTKRTVILPDKTKATSNATTGQAGREIIAALFEGRTDDALQMLRADRKLATTEVGFDPKRSTERPQGQYGDLLTIAVSRCDLGQINALLDAGLSPDGAQTGQALTTALLADSPEMAELLLSRGASPDPQKKDGVIAFYEVAAFGHIGGAMTLLRHGLDLQWQDQFGADHLDTAVTMQQFRIAELLIDKGANPWRIGGAGNMAVQYLVRPSLAGNKEEEAARLRLVARIEKDAVAKGLPWPPPDFVTVRQKVLAGNWPTAAMQKAGIPVPTPIAMADMRKRFAGDAPNN
jgi:hypothetical protein